MRVTFDHALRIIKLIASSGGSVSSAECAAALGIGCSYTRTVLGMLKRHDLVIGERGQLGGYQLADQPQRITLLDILEAVDSGIEGAKDAAMRASRDEPRIDAVIAKADRAYLDVLSRFTVAHLLEPDRMGGSADMRGIGRAS